MKHITLSDLKRLNACWEAQEWFNATYPDGAEITVETLATVPEPMWIVWLASKLQPSLGWTWAGIAFRYAAKQHPTLSQYVDNVTPLNWREAKADAAYAYAYAASAAANAADDAAYYAADDAAYYVADAASAAAYYAAADAAAAWNEMTEIAIRSLLEAVNG